jgi:succinate-acetate transporter protein
MIFLTDCTVLEKNYFITFYELSVASWTKTNGTWQCGGFSGVFVEIDSSWVPYTTFRADYDYDYDYEYLRDSKP